MENKFNINVRQYAVHLIGRIAKMAGDVTIYGYKNILRGQ